jgi:hypothetical protein
MMGHPAKHAAGADAEWERHGMRRCYLHKDARHQTVRLNAPSGRMHVHYLVCIRVVAATCSYKQTEGIHVHRRMWFGKQMNGHIA